MVSILEFAKGSVTDSAEMFIKDTGYIPADKLHWCPMGCAKTAADILKEIAGGNLQMATGIGGLEHDEEFAKRLEQASTLEEYVPLIRESVQMVCRAIDTFDEADLDKDVIMPWGGKFPAVVAIFLPTSHINYHDGQINYIQTLLGDDKFHWIEG